MQRKCNKRNRSYSKEPSSAYASNASSCKYHGHICSTCTECAPHEKEQQRELKTEMATINIGDRGEQREEDGGGEKIRSTDVAGMMK